MLMNTIAHASLFKLYIQFVPWFAVQYSTSDTIEPPR